MLQLILFEIKKMIKSTFFLITIALLCLLMLGYYGFVSINTVKPKEIIAEIEAQLHVSEPHLQEMEDMLNDPDNKDNHQLKQEIEISKKVVTRDQEAIQAYREQDWITILNQEIELGEAGNVGDRMMQYSTHPTTFTADTYLDYQLWLRDKQIQPILHNDSFSWVTAYDIDFGHPSVEEFIKQRSDKHSATGTYYLNHLFTLLFGLVGPILFILLFGDVLTKEGLSRNGSIHLLRTQPISPHKVIWSKLIATIIVTGSIFIGIGLVSILIGTLFDRFGDLDYPVLIYGESRTYHFIEMGTFLLKVAFLSLMVLLFCYSLLFLFSLITRRAILTVGLTIGVILMGIKVSEELIQTTFSPYLPFTYFSVPEIVTNELAATVNSFEFSFGTGLIVLSIYSIIIYLLAYLVYIIQIKKGY